MENNFVNQRAIESKEEIQRFVIRENGFIREESENDESQMENHVNHQFFSQIEERQPFLNRYENLLSYPQNGAVLYLQSPSVEEEEKKSDFGYGSFMRDNFIVNQNERESTGEISRFIIRESGSIREESKNNETLIESNTNHQEGRESPYYYQWFNQEEEKQTWPDENLLLDPQTNADLFLRSVIEEEEEFEAEARFH